MKAKRNEITKEDILEHWRQGKSSLDWRRLITIKEKREWLQACLSWTGLPTQSIKAVSYVMDGSEVQSDMDFYCLLGETFFGYRGYFGQDFHGLTDCFSEIFLHSKNKETVEKGAKMIMRYPKQIHDVLQHDFHDAIEQFRDLGFEVELE